MDVLLKRLSPAVSTLAGIRLCGVSICSQGVVNITGTGIFRDAKADREVRTLFFDGETFPAIVEATAGAWTLTANVRVAALEYSGDAHGEPTFDIGLTTAPQPI